MKQIDLDDLPPRVARMFAGLAAGEQLTLVQGGGVVARLQLADEAAAAPAAGDLPAEAGMEEIMEHFNAMIHDEF